MKKTSGVVFVFVLLSSTIASLQFASLVKANPVPYPSKPNTELPTLTVQTPQNYSDIYAENSFILNYSVTKPKSWDHYHMGIPVIGYYHVFIYLDNNQIDSFIERPYHPFTKNYSVVLNQLTNGWHTLQIDVRATSFYKITKSVEKPLEHVKNISATINFNSITENKTILLNTHETTTIPEFPSWAIFPLLLTIILVVTIYRKRLTKKPTSTAY
jgi:hypothetical protein